MFAKTAGLAIIARFARSAMPAWATRPFGTTPFNAANDRSDNNRAYRRAEHYIAVFHKYLRDVFFRR